MNMMDAIKMGLGGLRKTSGAVGPASPGAAKSPSAAAAVTSPVRTFNAPGAKSPVTSPSGSTQPAAARPSFGAPRAAVVTSPAATAAKPAAAPAPAPAPKKVTPEDGAWKELQTPEGVPYYHNSMTNVTTWDKPECLKTDADKERAGHWVWLPDAHHAFVPAKKLETFYDGRVECEKEDGSRVTVGKNVVLEDLTWSSLRRPVRDLVMLDVMNQPLILHNLKDRFAQNEIYTNVGTILISMNPYKLLPLYTPTTMNAYRCRGSKDMAPHIYTIADDSFNSLIDENKGQSIVISGESGAGKTECTKHCLSYLAEIAGSTNGVESRILQANPILEGFGNAKTIRNNNSSRFGKYVEIFFDKKNSICGAQNTNYLLEKVRVVHQTGDERNYHIFYQLCAGASAEQRSKYHLADAESFGYLNQSGNVRIDGVDDAHDFREVEESMDGLQFTAAEKNNIFSIVAWILHMGNLVFLPSGDKKCTIEGGTGSGSTLSFIAKLMEVDTAALAKAITNRVMVVRGQAPMDISLSVEDAQAARDALSKHTFSRLFDWLVERINKSIGIGAGQKGRSIGILDIFGFEIFQLNSFEQLCINFANEKLQQLFNYNTFALEETVYAQEKIDYKHVAYIDNQPVLDLIEQKPKGIMPMIDEELRMPNGSDKSFVDKLHSANQGAKPYGKVIQNPMNFLVRHYAGDVVYSVDGFLLKNKDRLNEDVHALLQTSQCAFLKALFPPEDGDAGSRKATLGMKFRTQLDELMATLNSTQPHYVRCIKPNPRKAPLEFDGTMTLQQLTYSGVFEAITIRKQGFPFRHTHENFMKRFKAILPKKKWASHKEACVDLIKTMGLDTTQVQIGVTMVLYRAQEHKLMELKRNIAVEATVVYVQKIVRGYQARVLAKTLKKHKPVLRAAIQSRDLAKIESALSHASGLKFPLFEWEEAKKLKALIIEENRVTALLEGLVKQDPEVHFEALSKACAAADDCGLQNAVATKCRALLLEVVDRKKTRAWLVEGVSEADASKLAWAIKRAAELQLNNAAAEIKAAKDMQERIEREQIIIAKVEAALGKGGYIQDGDNIDCSALEAATAEARKFGMRTKEGIRLEKQGDLFIAIRRTMSAALGTKDKPLWKAVEESVIAAGELYGDHVEVVKAREEVSHQAAVDEVCEKLARAVDYLDQDQMAYLIAQAHTLQVDVVKYPVVPVAQQFLDRIHEGRKLLAAAMASVEQGALEAAVAYAESFGYDTPEVQAARTLRDTVIQLNAEAAHAVVQLEEEPMRDILKRADAVKLSTEHIEKIRTLLLNTPEEKFIQMQLRAAVALNDPARSIRVTIRLKDMFFAKSAALFAFDNYSKLRTREGWADLKLISFSRDELAAGMRKHTKDPIHDPLTEINDPKQVKVAKLMFKNILGFCGDKQLPGPMQLAHELCQTAITEKWVRDELYCQLVKQLTSNPNRESEQKGWWLMAIFLETFPPPQELENYLECWLRAKAPETGGMRDRLVKTLHATVYGGQRQQPPSESEMTSLQRGQTLRQRGFEVKSEYVVPKGVIPPRQAPQPILGVVPVVAGGQGMAGYNPNASAASYVAAAAAVPARPARPGAAAASSAASNSMPPPPPADDGAMPPPPPEERPPCPWQVAYHPDTNQPYYYHTVTNETTWERPADFWE